MSRTRRRAAQTFRKYLIKAAGRHARQFRFTAYERDGRAAQAGAFRPSSTSIYGCCVSVCVELAFEHVDQACDKVPGRTAASVPVPASTSSPTARPPVYYMCEWAGYVGTYRMNESAKRVSNQFIMPGRFTHSRTRPLPGHNHANRIAGCMCIDMPFLHTANRTCTHTYYNVGLWVNESRIGNWFRSEETSGAPAMSCVCGWICAARVGWI